MSEKTIRVCDNCGAPKTDAVNHWTVALVSANELTSFCSFEDADKHPHGVLRQDYCGQKCAGDAFHRLLNTGSVVKVDAQGKTEASNEG